MCFLVFDAIFVVRWTGILVKVILVAEDVSRMIFKGGILGGARHFWGDPTLTVPLYCLI